MQQVLLALRVLLLVRHPDLRSTGPLSRRSFSIAPGWALPRESVIGALCALKFLEQARTSLAVLAPAVCPVDTCCGRLGRHPVFPCSLLSVPVHL